MGFLKKLKLKIIQLRDRFSGIGKLIKRFENKCIENLNLQNAYLLNLEKNLKSTQAINSKNNFTNKKLGFYNICSQYINYDFEKSKKICNKNNFLLFDYSYHTLEMSNWYNLGDYVQSIATKNALDSLFENLNYEYFDRDSLSFYKSKNEFRTNSIMQGWFSYGFDFMPSKWLNPIYFGTHFTAGVRNFLLEFLVRFPSFFKELEIGCRDKFTLEFCQNYKIKSYFSRCLSLTLPKREPLKTKGRVFFVDVNNEFLNFIPENLKQNAEFISQRSCNLGADAHWDDYHLKTLKLLKRYENEASLIITSALHCASPATALGIPVILLCENEEQTQRFGALEGILKFYTLKDFKEKRVNFSPKAPDIEE